MISRAQKLADGKLDGQKKESLQKIYNILLKKFGPQKWWPAKSPFEVIVGAILTQNTNWGNVEKAVTNLREKRLLNPPAIHHIAHQRLANLIKPAGYFNVKAKRIKSFVNFFYKEYGGNIKKMEKEELYPLRKKLLSVHGIGPETADSILLYALNKPIFVVDAYTKRVFYRHRFIERDTDYHTLQDIFMDHLSSNAKTYNEYHALIVALAKDFCKTTPRCGDCPLNNILYSLKMKCSQCHRALPKKEERIQEGGRYFCRVCKEI